MRRDNVDMNTLEATLHVGKSGVTDAIVQEFRKQIDVRDAVKVKFIERDRELVRSMAAELAQKAPAKLAGMRGHTAVYRKP
ncbi:MAG: YhbY family RNA-binding protein [Euryarchaeota archaeon]|nr:YhbY family RNA-binding protein [Euryarchaeota archaeon]